MPEKRKEPKNCHDCGLEDIEACENSKVHRSSRPELLPCNSCVRNQEKEKLCTNWRADFWEEQWRLNAEKQPGFDDIQTSRQHELLQTLHLILMEVTTS